MAVETNKDAVSPAQTLTGVAAAVTNGNGKAARRKRPSSLLSAAGSLPSVESSLDEFISRANQTFTDPEQWGAAEQALRVEDDQRREADLLRMRAAEQQLREGEAREQSLRRQLDGLQGRLAEAEARAAVANSGGTQDGVIADLKLRLSRADERIAAADHQFHQADARAQQLAQELTAAKSAATAVVATPSAQFYSEGDSDERVRLAEAKATKAIAIARAASAGLTVSPSDIAAIESGLTLTDLPVAKGTNWIALAGCFIGGLAIAFGISLAMKKDAAPVQTPTAATATQPAPAAAPAAAPTAPVKPTITPIDDNAANTANAAAPTAAPAPAEQPAPEAAKPVEVAQPIETPKAEVPAKVETPKASPKHVAPAKHTPAPQKAKPAASGGIADPFGDAPKKSAPAKKTDKKAGNAIVDPF